MCLLAATAPVAQAGPLVQAAEDCDTENLDRAFLPWLDFANYTLAPGGSMEGGATGWSLSGASVVAGNEPFHVHGDDDASSLALPAGSSATTAAICVGLEHPTLRFFARSSGSLTTLALSSLKVDVLFQGAAGNVVTLPIGIAPAALHTQWRPTLPVPIIANLLPLLPGERTAVAFRFTPQGQRHLADRRRSTSTPSGGADPGCLASVVQRPPALYHVSPGAPVRRARPLVEGRRVAGPCCATLRLRLSGADEGLRIAADCGERGTSAPRTLLDAVRRGRDQLEPGRRAKQNGPKPLPKLAKLVFEVRFEPCPASPCRASHGEADEGRVDRAGPSYSAGSASR